VVVSRLVEFEHDRDPPTYFDDRVTLLEAASEGDGSE